MGKRKKRKKKKDLTGPIRGGSNARAFLPITISKTGACITAFLALLGAYISIDYFSPRLQCAVYQYNKKDPLLTQFLLSNQGNTDIYNLSYKCRYLEATIPGLLIKNLDVKYSTDKIPHLPRGRGTIVYCRQLVDIPVSRATIEIDTEYTLWIPKKFHNVFPFQTETNSDGNITWSPISSIYALSPEVKKPPVRTRE